MWSFRESRDEDFRRSLIALGTGAVGGLAVGLLFARRGARTDTAVGDLRERVTRAADRFAPGRRARTRVEETELAQLEDVVLDGFLSHEVLSERGIDVGAISRGIIELSGSVWTEEEADLAVRVANAAPGVHTVVNRLEIEEESRQRDQTRQRFEDGDPALRETRWEGRIVGMGRMRQGAQTEPDRPDDSQHQAERALEQADRQQWEEEAIAHEHSRMSASAEDRETGDGTDFEHDELDNQDPHRRHHTRYTLDEQPQAQNPDARVGEGMKPGTRRDLEREDLAAKPAPLGRPGSEAGEGGETD